MPDILVVELNDERAKSRVLTGGKGASLAQVLSLGFPSPQGFCITTNAYVNHLTDLWLHNSYKETLDIYYGKPNLSRNELLMVKDCITTTELTKELQQAVRNELKKLESRVRASPLRVAIRSSATAEDLPEASFAGQHDTFLNILDEDTLLDKIKKCWASFWSERAYFYRNKKGFDHWKTSMAVVIEELIPATESGTLFMANPVTHNVKEAIVEASWGLGELVVSGRVTPDTYYINLNDTTPILTKKLIKNKRRMLLPSFTAEGGTHEVAVPPDKIDLQVLPDQTILDLVRMGIFLTQHYGHPLDIEWARYAQHLYILQARPITSLKPLR